jgi:hypothetical protein
VATKKSDLYNYLGDLRNDQLLHAAEWHIVPYTNCNQPHFITEKHIYKACVSIN